ITKKLISAMNGEVHVESFPGKGTTFEVKIEFPLVKIQEKKFEFPNARINVYTTSDITKKLFHSLSQKWFFKCEYLEEWNEFLKFENKEGNFVLIFEEWDLNRCNEILIYFENCIAIPNNIYFAFPEKISKAFPKKQFLRLPIRPEEIQNVLVENYISLAAEITQTKDQKIQSPTFSNLKVLLAEDNPNNQKVLSLMLRRIGVQPIIVDNGKSALDFIQNQDLDLVILDVQMPEMDGLTAAKKICSFFEKNPNRVRPKLLALTANAFTEDRERCIAAGFDYYEAKPITTGKIRDILLNLKLS
ncbi:MAG: response regulator, partial [Chthoniobacterales bacterium]|nr:response regulator [Chthoniobacterales bacterium]